MIANGAERRADSSATLASEGGQPEEGPSRAPSLRATDGPPGGSSVVVDRAGAACAYLALPVARRRVLEAVTTPDLE